MNDSLAWGHMRIKLPLAALALLSVSACSGSGHPDVFTPGLYYSERVEQSTFPGKWPVIPPSGLLGCDPAKGVGAVTFSPIEGDTTYAVNGTAKDWGPSTHWADSKEIWNGENWGDFIDTGLRLCKGVPSPPVYVVNGKEIVGSPAISMPPTGSG